MSEAPSDGDEEMASLLWRVLDALPAPVFVKDRERRFVWVNQAILDALGRDRTEVLGKQDAELVDRETAQRYEEQDAALLERRVARVVENTPFRMPSGELLTLSTTKIALPDGAGEPTHIVGLASDVTSIEEERAQLRARSEQLAARVRDSTVALEETQVALLQRERLATIGELASALAHQLRNPLGAISNASYVLSRALAEHRDSNVERAIAIVHEEAWRASRIIGDLLDYARISPPSRTSIAFATVIARAPLSVELRRALSVELEELPLVHVDEDQVARAVANLVRFAADVGGPVRLSAALDGDAVEIVIVNAEAPPVDPPPAADDAANPRLDAQKPLDVALSLATARALVENQGGRVTLTPEGAPCRFTMRLPVAPASSDPPRAPFA